MKLIKHPWLLFCFFCASCLSSCTSTDEKEYQKLSEANAGGAELLNALIQFDSSHPSYFQSKLDLGDYYFTIGDITTAENYLARAESVIGSCPGGKEGKKQKSLLYGLQAQYFYYSNAYSTSLDYIQKAKQASSDDSLQYDYLAAKILYQQDKKTESLKKFDETYAEIPTMITDRDEQLYLYLLADAERNKDCIIVLEDYLSRGAYFEGLGRFSSVIYEKESQYIKSILSTYLDYLYLHCFADIDDSTFCENLDELEKKESSGQNISSLKNAIDLVKSIFNSTATQETIDGTQCFIAEYITLAKKIDRKQITEQELNEFISYEKYFHNFPCYYVNLYNALTSLSPSSKRSYIAVLEKILSFGESSFSSFARKEIGSLLGFSDEESKYILVPNEVQFAVNRASQTGDREYIDSILNLLTMGENTYELSALQIVKSNLSLNNIKLLFEEAYQNSSGKLKERLAYVLYG